MTTTLTQEEATLALIKRATNLFQKRDVPFYQYAQLSDQKIERLYEQATLLYEAEKYQQAAELFEMLVVYHSQEPKYWNGLAASYQMLKKYQKAIAAYSKSFSLQKEDPLPLIHLFECYMELHDGPRAVAALESILLITKNKQEDQAIYNQAKSLKEILIKSSAYPLSTLAPL